MNIKIKIISVLEMKSNAKYYNNIRKSVKQIFKNNI